MSKKVILKIGGSILYDKELNINFRLLAKIHQWYFGIKPEYEKIVMIVGGGALSRNLQEKITEDMEDKYLHNIGMSVTQTNAALMEGFLNDPDILVPVKIGEAYEYLLEKENKTLVSGGLKVGWSTDMDAAVFADMISVDRVFKLSDINYVYNKDPKQNEDAVAIKDMTWQQYFELFNISEDDSHGANAKIPIDVHCARFCQKKNIAFFVCGGKSIVEKESILDVFTDGTLIHN